MASQPFDQVTALLPGALAIGAAPRLPHLALVDARPLPADRQPDLPIGATINFGRFRLQLDRRQLLVDGQPVSLGSRAFDVLLALLQQRHRVVSQGELMQGVWPGLVVESNTLQVHVCALRKLLGDGAVATVARRGYRFTASVDGDCPAVPPAALPMPAAAAGPYTGADLAHGLAVYLFDGLEIHPGARLVVVKGRVEILRPQAMALLMALVDRRLRPVGKLELMRLVWPGKAMGENNLQVQVAALRKLLGPSVIATIPGEGYLFNIQPREFVAVSLLAAGAVPSGAASGASGPPKRAVLLPRARAALSLLARAIQITSAHELTTEEPSRREDPALPSARAGPGGSEARACVAAAAGSPALANDPMALGDALVQLGARLVALGKREQALSCMLAAAALWSSAESPGRLAPLQGPA